MCVRSECKWMCNHIIVDRAIIFHVLCQIIIYCYLIEIYESNTDKFSIVYRFNSNFLERLLFDFFLRDFILMQPRDLTEK